jgi:hypothetical protein
MITLYHRTDENIARKIIDGGFRDGKGYYMTPRLYSGVWVSDQPLDENEGANGNALIRIELAKDEHEIEFRMDRGWQAVSGMVDPGRAAQ